MAKKTKSAQSVKTKTRDFDVVIIGGGLSGLTLACLLAPSGMRIACVDQQDPKTLSLADTRTTAISAGSRKILESAGIWGDLEKKSCPILDIEIRDGNGSPVLLDFLSDEIKGQAFGWIAENRDLRAAMARRLKSFKNITHMAPAKLAGFEVAEDQARVSLSGGQILSAQLVIGADGRASDMRKIMGVDTRAWDYRQQAIVCIVRHEHAHNHRAVEHFWPEGPFAILPMTDDPDQKAALKHRSAVVFTQHGQAGHGKTGHGKTAKKSLMEFTDHQFEAALAARFPGTYGAIELAGKRASYPLGFVHAASYIAPRAALVADAAHGIHPIAGQGLNLGFRDVSALASLLSDEFKAGRDIGAQTLLQNYERQRRIDNMAMAAFTDGLVRLFSNDILPIKALRRAGLRAVSKLPAAKRFFMRKAMGER